MNFLESTSDIIKPMLEKIYGWGDALVVNFPNIVLALLIFAGAVGASRLVHRWSEKGLNRVLQNAQIAALFAQILRWAVVAFGLFSALGVLNLDKTVTSMLAGVGVVGLALGFAFQDIAANFMSGIFMAFRRPFHIGDYITTKDFTGTVRAIDLRSTKLELLTGEEVIVPNRDVHGTPITNYTSTPFRRVDIEVGVGYDDDLRAAKEAIVEALLNLETRFEDRPAEVFYTGFGGSSINLVARFWIDNAAQVSFLGARSEAIIGIKQALDEAGCSIPYPIRTLDFSEGTQALEQVALTLLDHDSQDREVAAK